jgi:hypothetical protein
LQVQLKAETMFCHEFKLAAAARQVSFSVILSNLYLRTNDRIANDTFFAIDNQ